MIEQLLEFYYKYDMFQEAYLPEERARQIYQLLLDSGRLHICQNEGKLLGYGEQVAVNFETFGRIVCGLNIYKNLDKIDIENGEVAVLLNVTIHPEYRNIGVIRYLRNDFILKNKGCKFFTGHALRKTRTQPWKVFSVDKVLFNIDNFSKEAIKL